MTNNSFIKYAVLISVVIILSSYFISDYSITGFVARTINAGSQQRAQFPEMVGTNGNDLIVTQVNSFSVDSFPDDKFIVGYGNPLTKYNVVLGNFLSNYDQEELRSLKFWIISAEDPTLILLRNRIKLKGFNPNPQGGDFCMINSRESGLAAGLGDRTEPAKDLGFAGFKGQQGGEGLGDVNSGRAKLWGICGPSDPCKKTGTDGKKSAARRAQDLASKGKTSGYSGQEYQSKIDLARTSSFWGSLKDAVFGEEKVARAHPISVWPKETSKKDDKKSSGCLPDDPGCRDIRDTTGKIPPKKVEEVMRTRTGSTRNPSPQDTGELGENTRPHPGGRDLFGQPTDETGFKLPSQNAAGSIDICNGNFEILVKNMQVCDPSPSGEEVNCQPKGSENLKTMIGLLSQSQQRGSSQR